MNLWIAFSLGLVGSLHCAGMCGPISLALPIGKRDAWGKFLGISLYSLGRILTYSLFGLLFGLFGRGLALAGWQQGVSIAAGSIMILSIILPSKLTHHFKITAPISRLSQSLRAPMLRFMRKDSNTALFGFGLLNGMLPCGLVYIAILGSLASSHPFQGAVFMGLFGLGTVPMMGTIIAASQWVSGNLRARFRRWIPIFVLLVGALFVLRGLGVGIPYLSPPNGALAVEQEASCH